MKIRPCSIAEFYGVSNAVWPDQAEDPVVAEQEAAATDPEHRALHWIAEADGIPVGSMEIGHDIGSFHPERWQIFISVLPEARRRGIGSALAKVAFDFLDEKPWTSITTWAKDEPQSIQFAEKLGLKEMKRDFWSVLDLENADMSIVETMRAKLPSSMNLQTYRELDTPENRLAIHELFEIVRLDTPRVTPPTRLTYEQFDKLVLNDPQFEHDCSVFALQDGQFVAQSTAFLSVHEGQIDQGLTAVRREERGKGLAQATKAEVVLRAIEKGYKQLRTDNDSRNLGILSINERLGFKRLPATITMMRLKGDE